MMTHYFQIKEQYKDCIVLYRLGDFYEMFFDDAVVASEILDLVLTGRDCGDNQRAPMCGVPFHAVDNYIAKLIQAGKKVAICEQLTDPKLSKGMVERGVVRVITPGTVMENTILEDKQNNFLASLESYEDQIGCAFCDISTGQFFVAQYQGDNAIKLLQETLIAYMPSEIIADTKLLYFNDKLDCIKYNQVVKINPYHDFAFDYKTAKDAILTQYNINSLKVFDIEELKYATCAAGALIEYLIDTQKRTITHLNAIKVISNENFMSIDINTRRNLELVTSKDKKKGSLLWLLDKTRTNMGGRMLYSWIERPLQNANEINARLDAVMELSDNFILRDTLDKMLYCVKDIERLAGKISYNNLSPRDCNALQSSLRVIPDIKGALSLAKSNKLVNINLGLIDLNDIENLLFSAIIENAPTISRDGGFIKKGYNAEFDTLVDISQNSKSLIAKLETKERELTGIKTLKVGYNRVFGYYFEVSNSYKNQIPSEYIRKQTLTNGERYVSEELKKLEESILNAEEKSLALEKQLFEQLRNTLLGYISQFQQIAHNIAELDSLLSFAKVSLDNNYVRPSINIKNTILDIVDGRHPVVESFLKSGEFIANDTLLDTGENRTMVITGPNMAGKSTYMRQVALITFMAHIGCFVPAKKAVIPIVDKIFTRVGASDDLSFNQSTFMVEMIEVAYILNNATEKSLIILDEVGRGTSTFDGLSIAWAVLEFISQKLKAKTLFATHYHELTELEGTVNGVKNYKITVKEINDSIIFLRKITRGGANKSFGIEVAKLAGVNQAVISRAKELVNLLEKADINLSALTQSSEYNANETTTKTMSNVISIIKDVNLNECTPLKAFDILNELVSMVKKDEN